LRGAKILDLNYKPSCYQKKVDFFHNSLFVSFELEKESFKLSEIRKPKI
jgi:hypothetical protein